MCKHLSTYFQFGGYIPRVKLLGHIIVLYFCAICFESNPSASTVCNNYCHSLGHREGLITRISVLDVTVSREYQNFMVSGQRAFPGNSYRGQSNRRPTYEIRIQESLIIFPGEISF